VNGKIRVLIVDDSAIVRKVLTDLLSGAPDIEVVGTAPDPYVARDKILALKPDLLTLDIEMPRMDGLTFLGKLMRHQPMPVVVISSLGQASCTAAVAALRLGAVDVIAKPGGPYSVGDLRSELPARIRAAVSARVRPAPEPAAGLAAAKPVSLAKAVDGWGPGSLIAIGASTGGVEALERVLSALPASVPPIVVVQHIPAGFSRAFADRLNRCCALEVAEAMGGELATAGRAFVAPGNFHMEVQRVSAGYRLALHEGPKVCYQRPAVDVLFASVAAEAQGAATGVLLTGMGSDGAQGMLALKRAGARTIAQDEATSVVYGMPREALRLGAVDEVLPLGAIPAAILSRPATAM
jgi:two-component system chemotaxis response regulator CheB